jgi:predicted O-methyltransferase YrrM
MDKRNFIVEDGYALQLIRPLLEGAYLPFTNSSLRPLGLAYLMNDIVVNARKSILEFGSGISTILMGRLIRMNNLGAKIISVEHNRQWADIIQASIRLEGLEDIVSILYAPLKDWPTSLESNLWYELDADAGVFAGAFFDMVVIDGPPAYEASKELSRYPALPFIYDKLSARSSVFLDDVDRWGERVIINRWEKEYPVHFNIVGDSFAYTLRGDHFNLNVF